MVADDKEHREPGLDLSFKIEKAKLKIGPFDISIESRDVVPGEEKGESKSDRLARLLHQKQQCEKALRWLDDEIAKLERPDQSPG